MHHLGELARGGVAWQVHLEIATDTKPPKGRVHFVAESEQRSTGWIFIEASEADLLRRFHEFSALELWRVLESLS
ncbi:MAG: hypothetical protein FJ206_07380 [Gemmatimonadetes bacterium]|nr:hypothetical protein [Gemmatimonadota bacterium]